MNEDVIYIVDLFNMQVGSIKWELLDKALLPTRFDSLSTTAWAIEETLNAISHCEGLVTIEVVHDIIKTQQKLYSDYYEKNTKHQRRYKYALKTMVYLLKLSGGC